MLNQPSAGAALDALGDGSRRAIVERLGHMPTSVSDLADLLGVSRSAVLQHLKILERSGLVSSYKEGRVRTCELNPAGLSAVQQWLDELQLHDPEFS